MRHGFWTLVLALTMATALPTAASAQQLTGKIGSTSGPDWQSSWLDLTSATTFGAGERLKITVRGSAERVVVRLLPSGAHPGSSDGIVGGVRNVPKDGILNVQLPEERRNIVQISVHGGQKAWDITLGDKNGPVIVVSVERILR